MVYHREFAEYFIQGFCVIVNTYQRADIDEDDMMFIVWIKNSCILLYLESRGLSTFI